MSQRSSTVFTVAMIALPVSFIAVTLFPELVDMANCAFVVFYDHYLRFRAMIHG